MTISTKPSVPVRRGLAFQGTGRFHALDNLRAAMMLLGIVLHAGLSYSHMPRSAIWPYKDAGSSYFCDLIMAASGLFRMPVFFMVAGFFAALIYQRRGGRGLLADRARRILVPFVVGWVLTFPLARAGFVYADALARHEPSPLVAAARVLRTAGLYAEAYPIHLWFLEYLLIYYLLAVPIVGWASRLSDPARARVSARCRGLLRSAWRPLWLASLTAFPLLAAPMGVIPTPLSFVPEPVSLVAHGFFFAVGWVLFKQVDLLPALVSHARRDIALAVLLLPLCGLILRFRSLVVPPGSFGPLPPGAETSLTAGSPAGLGLPPFWAWPMGLLAQFLLAVTSSIVIWLLVLGVTGLFLRGLSSPNRVLRYLADASYWLYLVHFPLMIWTPILLAPLQAPALIKLSLVLAITMSLMLAAYEILVRRTFLAAFVARATPVEKNMKEVRSCGLVSVAPQSPNAQGNLDLAGQ